MRKTAISKKPAARAALAKGTAKSSAKRKRSSSGRSKKFFINFNYLAGVFLITSVLIAVFLGVQFAPKGDDQGQVAGEIKNRGSIIMAMPKKAKVGDTIKAVIWTDSKYLYNAAQANFTYSDHLEFVRVDDSNSSFDVDPPFTNDNNNVNLPKGTLTPLDGTQQLGTVEFTAVAEGKAVVALTDKTMLLSSDGNNNLLSKTDTYTIKIENK